LSPINKFCILLGTQTGFLLQNHGTKMLIAAIYHCVTEDRVREGIIV